MTFHRRALKFLRILANPLWRRALRYRVAATAEHGSALSHLNVSFVVDIGANKGQFTLFCRSAFPSAPVIAFEPLDEPARRFTKLFGEDRMVTLHKVALGPETGQTDIFVSEREDSSSLLPIGDQQVAHFPGTGLKEVRKIAVGPLRNYLSQDQIMAPALMKLDVQGYELTVLESCQDLLEDFEHVYVECSYIELYDGQATANEVKNYLQGQGYELSGVFNQSFDRGRQPIQADFLFRRRTAG